MARNRTFVESAAKPRQRAPTTPAISKHTLQGTSLLLLLLFLLLLLLWLLLFTIYNNEYVAKQEQSSFTKQRHWNFLVTFIGLFRTIILPDNGLNRKYRIFSRFFFEIFSFQQTLLTFLVAISL